ncbi:MAG: hypothetical protein HQ539_03680 [Parcubacteria group bacterium]|nr:hypothetical protein [Parcubacteria group bacterium]
MKTMESRGKIMESRGVEILVIDEAIDWEWDPGWSPEEMKEKMEWLLGLFPQNDKIPIFIGSSSHPYFNVWKAKTSFEITDESHPLYTECSYPELYPFSGPELVFEMAHPSNVQICWSHPPIGKGEISTHPTEVASPWEHDAHYVTIMSPRFCAHKQFLTCGTELCIKQLEMWRIDPQGEEFKGLL